MKFEMVIVLRDDKDNFIQREEIKASSLISLLQQELIVIQQLQEKLDKDKIDAIIAANDDIPF